MTTILLTALLICLCDWSIAATHMSYVGTTHRLPFYDRKLPRPVKDMWHLVGGFRYPALCLLAWYGFGLTWEAYVITAVIDRGGWWYLKRLHNKDWKEQWQI